jgi:hypothetical protein
MIIRKKGYVVVGSALLFFLISGIPYLYGWWISTSDVHFSGFVHNHEDHLQYFSLAKQAEEGKVLFEDRFTTTPHAPRLINWFWWGIGRIMAWTGWGLPFTHQFLRFFIILLYVGTLYSFLARFFSGPSLFVGFILILCGGGFGWIVRVLQKISSILPPDFDLPDVWLPESQAFLSMMITPTYCLAVTLMLWIFISFLKGLKEGAFRYFGLCGLINLLLLFFHPFEWGVVFSVCLLTGCFQVLSFEGKGSAAFKGLLMVLFISLPGLLYYVFLNRLPLWKDVLGQMALTSPDPIKIALGFGIPFFLALFTFRGLPPMNQAKPDQLLIYSWAVGGFFLLYLPVNFQFHLINGWQIPIYILALQGIEERIMPYWENRFSGSPRPNYITVRRVFYGLLFLSVAISPLYVMQAKIKNIRNHFDQLPYFIHQQEVEAMNWLRNNSRPGESVFSGDQIGNLLPAYTGNRVFTGHYCLTPDYQDKLKAVKDFWDQNNVSLNRVEWLKKQGIKYICQGAEERALGGYDPSAEFSKVFSNKRTVLYRVE